MSYANSHSVEDNTSNINQIDFPWPIREMQITNDSSGSNLQFKLNETETYRTLKPYETCTLEHVRVTTVYLNGVSVPFRVWGLG